MSIFDLPRRRDIRYWLYRAKKTQLDGTPLGDEAPENFQAEFEKMEGFTAWRHFAEGAPFGWDISEEPPYEIVIRNHSVVSEWNAELARTLRPLPEGALTELEVETDGGEGSI